MLKVLTLLTTRVPCDDSDDGHEDHKLPVTCVSVCQTLAFELFMVLGLGFRA